MLLQEFSDRTGFYPSADLYQVIEQHYLASELDKDEFCKHYCENNAGLAEKIQIETDMVARKKTEMLECERTKTREQLKWAERRLEQELEWKPYSDPDMIAEEEYIKMRQCEFTSPMSDKEAIDYVYHQLGFHPACITIVRRYPLQERNRHGEIRNKGELFADRSPLYGSSDYNYILFSCKGMLYEYHDGEFQMV